MIRRLLLASATLIAFAIAVPATAQAQLYVSAGAAIPSGDDMDGVDTGVQVAAGYVFALGESGACGCGRWYLGYARHGW